MCPESPHNDPLGCLRATCLWNRGSRDSIWSILQPVPLPEDSNETSLWWWAPWSHLSREGHLLSLTFHLYFFFRWLVTGLLVIQPQIQTWVTFQTCWHPTSSKYWHYTIWYWPMIQARFGNILELFCRPPWLLSPRRFEQEGSQNLRPRALPPTNPLRTLILLMVGNRSFDWFLFLSILPKNMFVHCIYF